MKCSLELDIGQNLENEASFRYINQCWSLLSCFCHSEETLAISEVIYI